MYLYLGTHPRTLYLITSTHDDKLGRPPRALVFRAAGEQGACKVLVEFLNRDEIEMMNLVRLSSRVVKGVLGLIAVDGGQCPLEWHYE